MKSPEGISAGVESGSFWKSISLMAEVTELCRSSSVAQPPFQEALRLIRKLLPFDAATLFTYSTRRRQFEARTSLDGRVEWLKAVTSSSADSQLTWSLPDKRPVLVSSADHEDLPAAMKQWNSIIAAPLFSGDCLVGVLNLAYTREGAFDENEIKLIAVITDLLAAATERWLHKDREAVMGQALVKLGGSEQASSDSAEFAARLQLAADLVASVHHQINNPLAVIVGNVQCLMIEKKDLDEKSVSRLKLIEKAALKVSKVNSNLLTVTSMAREQIGSGDLQRGAVSVR